MLVCPGCQSGNVFIDRAEARARFNRAVLDMIVEPAISTCRDCGQHFYHRLADCPPAAELVAEIAQLVTAGKANGPELKRYVGWQEDLNPAEKYQKIYNMLILARYGKPELLNPPAPAKLKRQPVAKKSLNK